MTISWAKVGPDTVVAVIQKVGSQSIIQSLPFIDGGRLVGADEAMCYGQRVAFVRDPMDRLISCFSHFYWLWKTGHKNDYIDDSIFKEPHQQSYQNFIDHILNNSDGHWFPQSSLLMRNGEYAFTVLHSFEDIHKKWPEYASGAIPWINSFTHIQAAPYRLAELETYYQEDRFLRGLCV